MPGLLIPLIAWLKLPLILLKPLRPFRVLRPFRLLSPLNPFKEDSVRLLISLGDKPVKPFRSPELKPLLLRSELNPFKLEEFNPTPGPMGAPFVNVFMEDWGREFKLLRFALMLLRLFIVPKLPPMALLPTPTPLVPVDVPLFELRLFQPPCTNLFWREKNTCGLLTWY